MDNGTVPADLDPPLAEPKPDGGPQYLDWSLPAEGLREEERGIIQNLGAAVVARWSVLPRDLQKLLFETAARGAGNAETLRNHIARFLHENGNPENKA
jgi:hypothetical protein